MNFQRAKIDAADMYVIDGMTVPRICEVLKLKQTTVYRWCKDGDWKAKRDEYTRQLGRIKNNVRRLRFELSEKALKTKDPQDVYALARIESLARKHNDDIDIENVPDDVSAADIRGAATNALKRLEGAKDIKITEIHAALKLAEAMEKRSNQNEKKNRPKDISLDTIEQVKSMYGLGG